MKHCLPWKSLILSGTLLIAGAPGLVRAQDAAEMEKLKTTVKSMEQTIEQMNRKVADLERQQTGVPTNQPADSLAKATEVPKQKLAEQQTQIPNQETMHDDAVSVPRPGNAPLDPTYQGFMPLFGTKTWIKLGGYAKLDAIMDSTKVGNPNSFITSKIPVEGEADFDKDARFAMHAKQTRLNVELRSPTAMGSLKIFYENDFFGNSDQPSMDYRLRHFYGQLANITVGQTWSTFYDPDVNPDTLDFEGPGVLPVIRQPQVRYTLPIVKSAMFLAFAIEQPRSDLGNLPATADNRNLRPDFATHWRYEGKPGHVQVGMVTRALSFDNNAGPDDTATGWGLNVSGALKIGAADNLMTSLSYGKGIGRYIQDLPSNNGGVVNANGDIDTLPAWGAMIAYRHQWNDDWRSTVSYSYVWLDNPPELGDFAFDHTHYMQANVIWAPTKNFYIGLEYLYGSKETRNGNDGADHRVQMSFQSKLIR